jgi:hypothetical protein
VSLQDTLATIAKSGLPLQGKLDAIKVEFETKVAPPEVVAVITGIGLAAEKRFAAEGAAVFIR